MQDNGPTVPPPEPGSLNSALARNIAALKQRHDEDAKRATFHQRMALAITRFVGSFSFVYLHLVLFGIWLGANLGLIAGVRAWDPDFIILGMAASVEAIFLSTFVLIAQNNMSAASDRRDLLDLQISLLAEHELTKLMQLASAIASHVGVETPHEMEELKRDVAPEAVLDALEDIGA
jgi:uncharacterized membrane protein